MKTAKAIGVLAFAAGYILTIVAAYADNKVDPAFAKYINHPGLKYYECIADMTKDAYDAMVPAFLNKYNKNAPELVGKAKGHVFKYCDRLLPPRQERDERILFLSRPMPQFWDGQSRHEPRTW